MSNHMSEIRQADNIIISTRSVSKAVALASGSLQILDDISLAIKSGETVAVIGRSGSGKSTLLGILAGLDTASAGQVVLDGTDITGMDEDRRAAVRAGRVGFVFQSFQLLPQLTALENVMLPMELSGDAAAREQATSLLKRVGLGARIAHYPRQLSGGEQQRVALARAFAGHPAILFADEPTGNLDATTGADVIELLFGMNREHGTTLVLVTHDAALAGRCGRVLALEGGRLTSDGDMAGVSA
jgi:putative ABC transport system ATP-binding protein